MEVVRGWSHRVFPITDASCIGEARRFCARAVDAWDWSDVDVGRLAIVVTELGTNLLRHAVQGQMWVAALEHRQQVEILTVDRGPGMRDVQASMQDGVSTGSGSPGTGLGAIRRQASQWDIHSTPSGTVILTRVGAGPAQPSSAQSAEPAQRWGAVSVPVVGESVCGDGWAIALDGPCLAATVVDGLGHGPMAAEAAQLAVEQFAQDPFADLAQAVQETHVALKTTRGAAVFFLHMNAQARVEYAGAGNVLGRALSGVFDRSLVTQHGTAGLQVRKTDVAAIDLPPHAMGIIHSDGIASRWQASELAPLLSKDPTLIAATLMWNHSRGRDDATVLVFKQGDSGE